MHLFFPCPISGLLGSQQGAGHLIRWGQRDKRGITMGATVSRNWNRIKVFLSTVKKTGGIVRKQVLRSDDAVQTFFRGIDIAATLPQQVPASLVADLELLVVSIWHYSWWVIVRNWPYVSIFLLCRLRTATWNLSTRMKKISHLTSHLSSHIAETVNQPGQSS